MLDKSAVVGQRTSKTAIKTADHTARAAQKTAQATAKAAKMTVYAAAKTAATTQTVETDDGAGNIVEEEVEVTTTTLYMAVTHKTADEMADAYNFTADQRAQLA